MRIGLLLVAAACGCGNNGGSPLPDMATAPAPDMAMSSSCMHTVPCTDNSIQDLSLFKTVNSALIENTPDGKGFASHVDASGGGMSPTKSFVYARFTDGGLVNAQLADEAAFTSTDWDIAFRRYVIRLNSGVSGPSCVDGTKVATDFDALTAPPNGASYDAEAYYDMSCTFVSDTSGLNAPGTIFADYWSYTGCLQMTGKTYVVQTGAGRHVKVKVIAYYDPPSAQMMCDQSGSLPGAFTPAQVHLRWSFLD